MADVFVDVKLNGTWHLTVTNSAGVAVYDGPLKRENGEWSLVPPEPVDMSDNGPYEVTIKYITRDGRVKAVSTGQYNKLPERGELVI